MPSRLQVRYGSGQAVRQSFGEGQQRIGSYLSRFGSVCPLSRMSRPEADSRLPAKPFGIEHGSPYPSSLPTQARRRRLWDIPSTTRALMIGGRGMRAESLAANELLKPQQVWAIRCWWDRERRLRDRALFDFAIDSKLRGCDVVKTKIGEVVSGAGFAPSDRYSVEDGSAGSVRTA